jgi:hypothetical protein
MSKVKITGDASGTGVFTIAAPGTNNPRTITLPDSTGTLLDENSGLPAANLTGTVSVSKGGTGATTHTANNVLVGNGTSAIGSVAPSTSGNVLTSNGSSWNSTTPAAGGMTLTTINGTATTSGTYYDILGIPSGVDKFYLVLHGVSTSGTADVLVQLNDAQGLEMTGYQSASSGVSTTVSSTTGFIFFINSGSDAATGVMEFSHITSNLWIYSGVGMRYASNNGVCAGGKKMMSHAVNGLRFKTTSGTFDGGSIYVQYWS